MSILRTQNITKRFGGLTAVSELSVELKKNQIVGLIGPNGAGKTTAFNMITGVYQPTEGEVLFLDQPITGIKPHEITKLGIARTFQNIRLFKDLTVLENVLIANHLRLQSGLFASVVRTNKYKIEELGMHEKSLELLDKVQLLELKDEKASNLPYGKQRKLEIARALATDPKVLLLDEPAAGMNPQESHELMNFIHQIRDQFDLSILMIEHHMKVVMGICENIYVLDYGVTIAQGSASEIQNNQKVIEAYLGVE